MDKQSVLITTPEVFLKAMDQVAAGAKPEDVLLQILDNAPRMPIKIEHPDFEVDSD